MKGCLKAEKISCKDIKSCWWMPRHWKAMKDVLICEKLRLAGKRRLKRKYPNGAIRRG